DLMIILEPIYHATVMLSSSVFPTQGDLCIIFYSLLRHLAKYTNLELITQSAVANAIKIKLALYWCYINRMSIISDLFDLYTKLETYELEDREIAISTLYQIFKIYKPDENNLLLLPTKIITNKSARSFFCRLITNCITYTDPNEIVKYLEEPNTELKSLQQDNKNNEADKVNKNNETDKVNKNNKANK
ncbi:413_t:CDS:2, partial [Cetraspora pellucida]